MSVAVRLLSGTFVSLPALLVGAWAVTSIGDEYYRPAYLIGCAVFLGASFVLGFLLGPRSRSIRFWQAWVWLVVLGATAWLIALAALGLLNLTPLCVGQDNGDGNNSFGQCVSYTILVAIVYSPLVLTLLALSAAAGGALIGVRKS